MKTKRLLPRLALSCLLALPAAFALGQAPATIVGLVAMWREGLTVSNFSRADDDQPAGLT